MKYVLVEVVKRHPFNAGAHHSYCAVCGKHADEHGADGWSIAAPTAGEVVDRNAVVEECAKVADARARSLAVNDYWRGYKAAAEDIAAALRALSSAPSQLRASNINDGDPNVEA